MKWSGVYTALITPFDREGQIDIEGLRFHIRRQKQAKVSGLVLLGTTGEAATLTQKEKEELLRVAKEEAGTLPLIVGCGSPSTIQTIENIEKAADLGYAGALIVTPYYNKPTQEGLYQHYAAISKSSSLPIILYNNPARTCVALLPETVKRLAQLPSIYGIKECPSTITQAGELAALLKKERPEFALLCGDDALIFPLIALGFHGAISGGATLLPQPILSLVNSCLQGDFQKARELHFNLLPLFTALYVETPPIPLKAALQLAGLPSGEPRLPLTPLDKTFLPLLKARWSNVIQTF